jgi:hypothetical protein
VVGDKEGGVKVKVTPVSSSSHIGFAPIVLKKSVFATRLIEAAPLKGEIDRPQAG